MASPAIITSLTARLKEIASHAPAKEPRDEPTVGALPLPSDLREYVEDLISQAYAEGYTRACWEMGQIADAALPA